MEIQITNKLIAEEVMGWYWDVYWGQLVPPEQEAKPSEMWFEEQTGELKHWDDHKDNYSYTIAENALVLGIDYSADFTSIRIPDFLNFEGLERILDRLDELGLGIMIHKLEYKRQFMVRIFNDNDHTDWFSSENLPLAVCRASLSALDSFNHK